MTRSGGRRTKCRCSTRISQSSSRPPLDSLLVEPGSVRQLFNDSEADQLWLVAGAPPEAANTLEMSEERLRELYPDGPKALPPELAG